MSYTQFTWGTLKTMAHDRVGADSFWTTTEMGLYLAEALRVWNLMIGRWRDTNAVATTVNTIFYNTGLTSQTVSDQDVLDEMQYHTLETPNQGASLSTDVWTIDEWIRALNARLAMFMQETKLVVIRKTFATTIGVSRYDLNTLLDTGNMKLHRVAWVADADGKSHGLCEADLFQYDNFLPSWTTTPGTPEAYVEESLPTQTVEIIPAPDAAGELDILYTDLATQLPTTPDGTVLGIPNDFTPYIKWGALADLLSKEGQAHDPFRAEYAETRFQEGIILAKILLQKKMHMRVEFEGTPLDLESLMSLDNGLDGWQADQSTPVEWFPVGLTQVGIHPAHAAGGGTLDIDGVVDAPIPIADGEDVDISFGEAELLVDYAHHLATFKSGTAEFEASNKLLERFQLAALKRNPEPLFAEFLGFDRDETKRPE